MADRAKVARVALWVLAPIPPYFATVGIGYVIGHGYPWLYGTMGLLATVIALISAKLASRREKRRSGNQQA
ncbi:hypothetical protein [Amycolatopsis magusensis]|uniref:hypothetical protein n=1 Tax=Amycolatopsis magusensis TaxID=882444 RepID=UPI00379E342D